MEGQVGKRFLIQWVIATIFGYILSFCFGLSLGYLLKEPKAIFPLILLSIGLCTSLCQWVVLRKVVKQKILGWVWIGWLGFIGISLALIINHAQNSNSSPLSIILSYPIFLSLGHWLVLSRLVKRSAWWVLIDFVGISFSGVLISFIPAEIPYTQLHPILVAVFKMILGGILQGLISGSGMVWLLQQRRSRPPNKSRLPDKSRHYDKPPAHNKGSQLLSFLSFGGAFVIWGHICIERGIELEAPFLVFMASLFVYFWFSILFHELGHLCLSLLCGAKLNFIAVLQFALFRDCRKLQVRFLRQASAGGLTSTIPSSPKSLRKKLIITILGGPLASLMLFLPGAILFAFPTVANQNYFLQTVTLLSGLNLYLAILNSAPIRIGYYSTDGYLISELAGNTQRGKRVIAIYEYLALLNQGIRPRDIETKVFEDALSILEPSYEHISGLMMSYFRELDAGNLKKAESYLRKAVKLERFAPEFLRSELFLESAYFDAQIRRSLISAKEWFDKAKETAFIHSYRLARVESAILLEEGNYVSARKRVQQGLKSANESVLEKGMAKAEIGWLRQILREVEDRN